MSLQLTVSDRIEDLLLRLAESLDSAQKNSVAESHGIPRPIAVLVSSPQLSDWIQSRLARQHGVSMGFEFLTPVTYFERQQGIGSAFALSCTAWSPANLRWHILPHVDSFAQELGMRSGEKGAVLTPRDRFAFAELLARQLDRYMRFRPAWPGQWRRNEGALQGNSSKPISVDALSDETWQRQLWQSLTTTFEHTPHPACIVQQPANAGGKPTETPAPLFVVGNDLLDPLMLITLARLSHEGTPVECFVLLPSLGYLGDVTRRKAWEAYAKRCDGDDPAEIGGHPLISSLGRRAVGEFLLLNQISEDYAQWNDSIDCASPEAAPTLLARIQADIRLQRPPVRPPADQTQSDSRPVFQPDDHSLRVHCCHSPRRELEVLRDELLRAFKEIDGLKPDEVLIAVTDFDTYAPLAEGVMSKGKDGLPVRLTAIPAREANPVAMGLLALLRMALGRRTASEAIELLNLSSVQQHLDVADDPGVLVQLAETIRNSGLTQGLDPADREGQDCTGTWHAAIDRVIAGSWFGSAANAQDAKGTFIHPLAGDLINEDSAKLRFSAWLTRVSHHLAKWREAASAAEWAERLEETIDQLLVSREQDDAAAAARRMLSELRNVAADTALDAGALLDWLQPQLENATSLRTSLGGEILFGRPDQIHSLPCRVLAILGLQDGAFPRSSRLPAWDLLAYQPEKWDADPRAQDRQWFLDSLLAPSERLVLTAANRSLRTAHDAPLSSCVDDLLRVAAATVRPAEDKQKLADLLICRHGIHPFAASYFQQNSPLPATFNHGAQLIAKGLANLAPVAPPPFFGGQATGQDSGTRELSLDELIRFWKDPARGWLRAIQIEVPEDEDDDTDLDDSILSLNGLQSYAVLDAALDLHLKTPSEGSALEAAGELVSAGLIADRGLPPGLLGNLAWEIKEAEVTELAQSLQSEWRHSQTSDIRIELDETTTLVGDVRLGEPKPDCVTPWVLIYRPGKFEKRPKYQLGALILTLAAAVQMKQTVACRVFGTDCKTGKTISPVGPDDARRFLGLLVQGYRQGQRVPLCYAPETSAVLQGKWAKSREAGLEAAEEEWEREASDFKSPGEGNKPAARLAWRDASAFSPRHADEWVLWRQYVAAPLQGWWASEPLAEQPQATPLSTTATTGAAQKPASKSGARKPRKDATPPA
jgi:exodeoxyribonuclease V gamma subunit